LALSVGVMQYLPSARPVPRTTHTMRPAVRSMLASGLPERQ
jgi:hypothetical protein